MFQNVCQIVYKLYTGLHNVASTHVANNLVCYSYCLVFHLRGHDVQGQGEGLKS